MQEEAGACAVVAAPEGARGAGGKGGRRLVGGIGPCRLIAVLCALRSIARLSCLRAAIAVDCDTSEHDHVWHGCRRGGERLAGGLVLLG